MKLARRRTQPIKETQMVSLADIAFLIIFFFMVTSTFMRDKTGTILPTLAISGESHSTITVTIDKDARLYLNGVAIGSPGTLEAELKGMLAGRTNSRDCEVRLRCHRGLTYKDYREVYAAISRAGGIIAIMHDPRR